MNKIETVGKSDYLKVKSQKRLSLTMKHDDPKAGEFLDQVAKLQQEATEGLKTMRAVFVAEDGAEDRHIIRWVKDGEDYTLAYANHTFEPAKSVKDAVEKLGEEEALKFLNQSYSTSSDDEQFRVSGTGRISVAVKVDAAKKLASLNALVLINERNPLEEDALIELATAMGCLKEAVQHFKLDIEVA